MQALMVEHVTVAAAVADFQKSCFYVVCLAFDDTWKWQTEFITGDFTNTFVSDCISRIFELYYLPQLKVGTVKFFNETKGFGFVKETATGQEYFVHVSGLLVDTIQEKDEVTFELKEGKKGLNAVNVRLK